MTLTAVEKEGYRERCESCGGENKANLGAGVAGTQGPEKILFLAVRAI